ncbi:MAG: response regulator [Chloracidobacterium sp.]|nr:response regulator [Chloracidobacterium sp.]
MARHRLLLADDSLTVQKVVNLTFADQGMDVATFADGDSAAGALAAVSPDIVLADVNMPGMNGYQLCEMMRSDPAFQNVPVLLLVGSFEPFDRAEAERVGANGHMTKPFSSIAELVSTVDALLAHSAPSTIEETSDEPLPDTSDIDSLYEKSMVEPPAGSESEFAAVENGLDDEMIQTSYVDAENEFVIEDEYYTGQPDDIAVEDLAEGSFQPASYPTEIQPLQQEAVEDDAASYDTGPFDTVASEPQAEELSSPTVEQTGYTTAKFDNADLLELPTLAPDPHAFPAMGGGRSTEITSLSPELIDLIVDKVVERLAERGLAGEAHSAQSS